MTTPHYQVQLLFCCMLSYRPLCNSVLVEIKFLKGKGTANLRQGIDGIVRHSRSQISS